MASQKTAVFTHPEPKDILVFYPKAGLKQKKKRNGFF
jgi:hypothetical protein